MSYRRRIISALSQNRQYIEGYCVVGTTDYTFQLGLSGTATLITVTPDVNGYWRWYMPKGKYISTWVGAFTRQSQTESDKLVSINFHLDYDDTARQSNNLFGTYTTETSYFACTNLKKVTNLKLRSTTMSSMFSQCTSLEEFDMSGLEGRTTGFASINMFYGCTNLKHIYGSKDKTYNVTSIRYMFSLCSNIEEFEFGNWTIGGTINRLFLDCGKLKYVKRNNTTFAMSTTIVNYLFQRCYELEDIGDLFNSNYADIPVLNITGMFDNCQKIKHIDISGVRMTEDYDTSTMFRNCYELEDIVLQQMPTAMTKSMASMFANCYKLTAIDGTKFAGFKPSNMASVFSGCKSIKTIDVSRIDFTACAGIPSLFNYCLDLERVIWSNTFSQLPAGQDFGNLFRDSMSIIIDANNHMPDISGVRATRAYYMYASNSSSLVKEWRERHPGENPYQNCIEVSLPEMPNGISANGIFRYNNYTTTITSCGNISATIDLGYAPLSLNSAILVLSKLQDVTSYGGATVTFSSMTRGFISADATAMALVQNARDNLGWTITI